MLHSVPQQHQITESPARLGLTTPISPLQSPQSRQSPLHPHAQQPNPHSIQPTVWAPSQALLSLLPPLSRAQSLILQMTSLASRLFDVSTKRSFWITSFHGSLPNFLPSQTQVSTPQFSDTNPTTIKDILSVFTTLQTQLFEAVAELQEILDLQDAKQKIIQEIRAKDTAILAFARKLRDAESALDRLMDDYSDYYRPKMTKPDDSLDAGTSSSLTTINTRLKLSDILSYAHRISYTTFAPPEFGSDQAPLRGALPPAPQEEQVRASQLYAFSDLDIGLPKIGESRENEFNAIMEAPTSPEESKSLPNLASVQGLIPPNIMVPSGWRPGMPVELPSDLPILPPPGWKPGDPISLPPLLPSRAEQRPSWPVPATQGFPKVPEPIQVRHVQLDITLDQDDESSEYSSDEVSSEDED